MRLKVIIKKNIGSSYNVENILTVCEEVLTCISGCVSCGIMNEGELNYIIIEGNMGLISTSNKQWQGL